MSLSPELAKRCNQQCELCSSTDPLTGYEVPAPQGSGDTTIALCGTCLDQINGEQELQAQHWRCLSDSMWSSVAAVQVCAWRMLKRLDSETWAQEALDMLYLDEDTLAWAQDGLAAQGDAEPTLDSNGNVLAAGDNVVIIKDLDVKGTSFVAKRGTAVRGISLTDNPEHIEGRVNGTRIVILTKYVKKA